MWQLITVLTILVILLVLLSVLIKVYNDFKCRTGIHSPAVFEEHTICAHCGQSLEY